MSLDVDSPTTICAMDVDEPTHELTHEHTHEPTHEPMPTFDGIPKELILQIVRSPSDFAVVLVNKRMLATLGNWKDGNLFNVSCYRAGKLVHDWKGLSTEIELAHENGYVVQRFWSRRQLHMGAPYWDYGDIIIKIHETSPFRRTDVYINDYDDKFDVCIENKVSLVQLKFNYNAVQYDRDKCPGEHYNSTIQWHADGTKTWARHKGNGIKAHLRPDSNDWLCDIDNGGNFIVPVGENPPSPYANFPSCRIVSWLNETKLRIRAIPNYQLMMVHLDADNYIHIHPCTYRMTLDSSCTRIGKLRWSDVTVDGSNWRWKIRHVELPHGIGIKSENAPESNRCLLL